MVAMSTPRRSKPKPAADAKKPARAGANINTYVDEDIRAAMDAFIEKHNEKDEHPATVRSTIEAALKMYLKANGFWPLPAK